MSGHHNDTRSGTDGGNNRRGTVKNAARLDAFADRAGHGSADWGGCDAERIQAVVVAITGMGGAVTFGLSRDQGAHSLTLLLDAQRKTLWFNGDAELDAALDEVFGVLDAMA